MNLLLDTNALIWWLTGSPRLSVAAQEAIAGAGLNALVSAVTGYEITLKQARGRLPAMLPEEIETAVAGEGFGVLPLSLRHAVAAARLPDLHRDPFDRLLVAQAMIEDLSIVSVDRVFAAYGVDVVW